MTEMTREDIIRMARETGGVDIESNGYTSWVGTQTTEFLERFAALIAAAERERIKEANTPEIEKVNKELRRLHEVNQELLEALQRIKHHFDTDKYAWKIAEAAIAKVCV